MMLLRLYIVLLDSRLRFNFYCGYLGKRKALYSYLSMSAREEENKNDIIQDCCSSEKGSRAFHIGLPFSTSAVLGSQKYKNRLRYCRLQQMAVLLQIGDWRSTSVMVL